MKFTSLLQRDHVDVEQVLAHLESEFSSTATGPDLAAVFVAGLPNEQVTSLIDALLTRWPDCCLFGCSAESVLANDEECEETAAVSIWAGHLPDVQVTGFHLSFERTPEGSAFVGWPEPGHADWDSTRGLLAVADPFSFPMDVLLERMNEDHPGLPIVGGMASAGQTPDSNTLWLGRKVYTQGAVMVQLAGELRLSTVVSQGCRPIGEPLVVTKVERNAVLELRGRPALKVLQELFQSLPTSEQRLVQHGLQMGRVISEYGDEKAMGDFLIRSIVGIEPDLQAIVVGDYFRPGQTVQFHLRDEASATFELDQLLKQTAQEGPAAGALLFTCNGRGTRLFSQPHHDVHAIRQRFTELPVAGFFAAGEIGPVGSENYFHGFTASTAIIRPLLPPAS